MKKVYAVELVVIRNQKVLTKIGYSVGADNDDHAIAVALERALIDNPEQDGFSGHVVHVMQIPPKFCTPDPLWKRVWTWFQSKEGEL